MKKLLIIIGCVVVFLVIGLVGVALFVIHTMEREKNRAKTANATANRWKKREDPTGSQRDPKTQDPQEDPPETVDAQFTVVKEEKEDLKQEVA
jgi:hypothetical protein